MNMLGNSISKQKYTAIVAINSQTSIYLYTCLSGAFQCTLQLLALYCSLTLGAHVPEYMHTCSVIVCPWCTGRYMHLCGSTKVWEAVKNQLSYGCNCSLRAPVNCSCRMSYGPLTVMAISRMHVTY